MEEGYFKDFEKLKKEVSLLRCRHNIECLLFYGTILKKGARTNDVDIIIVLKDVSRDSSELFDLLFDAFANIDFHLYSLGEIENGLSYYTREYVMEYLSKGFCLYGTNIFKTLFKKVTRKQYRKSILIRSIEHVQLVRKVLFSTKYSLSYKHFFLKKYTIRLSKNILLFKGILNYDKLSHLSNAQILSLMKEHELISSAVHLYDAKTKKGLACNFKIFCNISSNLVQCKKELGSFHFL